MRRAFVTKRVELKDGWSVDARGFYLNEVLQEREVYNWPWLFEAPGLERAHLEDLFEDSGWLVFPVLECRDCQIGGRVESCSDCMFKSLYQVRNIIE